VAITILATAAFPFLLFASGGLTLTEIRGALRRKPGESSKTVPGAQDLG
jgi:hypothetical protein